MTGNITKENFEKVHWSYYLRLEEEFLEIEKIIPIDEINEKTFSYKYRILLQSICSEIDTVFKKFIKFKNYYYGDSKLDMAIYKQFIDNTYETFRNGEITLYKSRFNNKKIYPYKDWCNQQNINWWTLHNEIKHDRVEIKTNKRDIENYKLANQENVLMALSGLFQLNMYFYKEIPSDDETLNPYIPLPQSEIFRLENWGDYYEHLIANKYYFNFDIEEPMLFGPDE